MNQARLKELLVSMVFCAIGSLAAALFTLMLTGR
jgi:hypothetical protein